MAGQEVRKKMDKIKPTNDERINELLAMSEKELLAELAKEAKNNGIFPPIDNFPEEDRPAILERQNKMLQDMDPDLLDFLGLVPKVVLGGKYGRD